GALQRFLGPLDPDRRAWRRHQGDSRKGPRALRRRRERPGGPGGRVARLANREAPGHAQAARAIGDTLVKLSRSTSMTLSLVAFRCAIVLFASAHAAEPGSWKAGAARVVITPEHFMQMSGYSGRGRAEGKLHDLWAKALVLEDSAGTRGVLVSLDLVGI